MLIVAAFTAPADARRFRVRIPIFSGSTGSSQTIDLVETLPDTETFERDGKYFDLGYLHSVDDKSDGKYVLYNGDTFMRIDTPAETELAEVLGRNPIEAHRSRVAAETGTRPATAITLEPREGESREAFRARARAFGASQQGSGTSSDTDRPIAPASRSGVGLALLIALLLVGGLVFGGRRFLRGIVGGASIAANGLARATDSDNAFAPQSHANFDDAVAARLRELSEPRPAGAPASMPAAAAPLPARTFGRRAV